MARDQLIIACCYSVIVGLLYDTQGRKITLFTGVAGMTLFLAITPKIAGSIGALEFWRIVFGFFLHITLFNPMILDFVDKETRGTSYGFAICGAIFGMFLAYTMVKCYDNTGDETTDTPLQK